MPVPRLNSRSGEEIRRGDRVLFHGNAAEIDFVACDPNDPDPLVAWHMKESGGGVMILDPPSRAGLSLEKTHSKTTKIWNSSLVFKHNC